MLALFEALYGTVRDLTIRFVGRRTVYSIVFSALCYAVMVHMQRAVSTAVHHVIETAVHHVCH